MKKGNKKYIGLEGDTVAKFLSEKLVSWSPWGPQFMKDQGETLMETLEVEFYHSDCTLCTVIFASLEEQSGSRVNPLANEDA